MKQNTEEIIEKIQPLLNTIGTALSLYPADSLAIKSISVVISVFNEIITFTDGRIAEERLRLLEEKIAELGIELAEFKQNVEKLDEHNQFVLRRHVKSYCVEALPETIEMRALAMIDFVMSEEHDFPEEICEIVEQLNRTDLEVLTRILQIVTNKELVEKRRQEAVQKKKEQTGTYKDRVYYLPGMTILWQDFLNVQDGEKTLDFSYLLTHYGKDEAGNDYYKYAMYCRSILKLQKLGVIDIDSMPLLGPSPVNNVCQFHLSIFGVELLKYL